MFFQQKQQHLLEWEESLLHLVENTGIDPVTSRMTGINALVSYDVAVIQTWDARTVFGIAVAQNYTCTLLRLLLGAAAITKIFAGWLLQRRG